MYFSILSYNQPRFNIKYVDRTAAAIGSVTVPSGSNFLSVTAKYNLIAFSDSGNRSDLPYNNSSDPFYMKPQSIINLMILKIVLLLFIKLIGSAIL